MAQRHHQRQYLGGIVAEGVACRRRLQLAAGGVAGCEFFSAPPKRFFIRSRMVWNVTYSIGTMKMPIELAASMPPNTAVPTARRLICGGAGRDHQRQQAEDEGDRGHHHRAEPHLRPQRGGFHDRMPGFALLLGEFDDQNAVLGGQRDQHHEADLAVKIEIEPGDLDRRYTSRARRRRPTAAPGSGSSSSRTAPPGTDRRTGSRARE